MISTSMATGLSAGNGEGSAASSAVATRQSSTLAMPRPHELLVFFRSNMEAQLTYARRRTLMNQNQSRANSGKITRYSERLIHCRIDRLLASGSKLKIRVLVVRFSPGH